MRLKSIVAKTTLLMLVVIVLYALLAYTLIDRGIHSSINDYIDEQANVVFTSIEWGIAPLLGQGEEHAVQRLIENIAANHIVTIIRVQDDQQRVMYSSEKDEIGQVVLNQCVAELVKTNAVIKKEIDIDAHVYQLAVPIRGVEINDSLVVNNVLYLGFNVDYVDSFVRDIVLRYSYVHAGMIIVILLTIFIIMRHMIGRPLMQLTDETNRVLNDSEQSLIQLENHDEFKILMVAMNKVLADNYAKNKSLHQALADAKEGIVAKSSFLANMSHEIRTPLNAIIGFSEILLDEEDDQEKLETLGIIKHSSEHLLFLINNILDYSKLDADAVKFEHKKVDIRQLVDRQFKLFSVEAKQKSVMLYYTIDNSVPYYYLADPFRLQQLIIIFLNNAIKFSHVNGVVELKVKHEDMLIIEISDNGIGISDDKLEQIFEPFTQGDDSTTRNYGGTGLGLSIAKKIIESMNGSVSVTSEISSGSRFVIKLNLSYDTSALTKEEIVDSWIHVNSKASNEVMEALVMLQGLVKVFRLSINNGVVNDILDATDELLPRYQQLQMHEVENAFLLLRRHCKNSEFAKASEVVDELETFAKVPNHHEKEIVNVISKKKRTLIIADDVFENRLLLKALVKDINYNILEAKNGREVIEICRKYTADVLLLDINMPELDGYEVLDILTQDDIHYPKQVVLMSGIDTQDIPNSVRNKADAIIRKPVDKRQLLALLSNK